jgi:hypothetical protein
MQIVQIKTMINDGGTILIRRFIYGGQHHRQIQTSRGATIDPHGHADAEQSQKFTFMCVISTQWKL